MDNKTLLAIILSVVVIIGSQFLFPAAPPQVKEIPPQAEKTAEKKAEPARTDAPPVVAVTPAATGKDIRVENDLYSAVLSSQGGTIKAWEIKRYKDKKGAPVILLPKPGSVPALAIGSNTGFDLSSASFNVAGGDLKLDAQNKSGSIVFMYSRDSVSVKRTYTFYADTYKVDLVDEVSGLPEYWLTLGADFGIYENDPAAHIGPTLLTGTDLKELKQKDLKEPAVFKDSLKWIAQQDKYFFSALVPETQVQEARAWMNKDVPLIAFKGTKDINKFFLYAGPKEHDMLAKLNLGLEHIIDFGFFSIIARPLFWILKLFYSVLGNYGWAIIFLTIIVRIPFIPIVNKGQASMKRLQDIQPKMNEIREKYKKDPQKMQAELMELYKKHKVSPMGGCLPMLLQIPVFFALYKVLLVSIELRSAPFMLWITDLSAPDGLFGHIPAMVPLAGNFFLGGPLPYLMGITMFIQQKMTPTGMDPKQAKMMLFMPVILTFMFLNFASGLVLYWLVNNILSIIQQMFVNMKAAKQPS
ncbi:MAG: membrane protein insertase YidC [Nitrospirae bacterium]|nr:membrane protein insertase YidC [Nitrospirota bacterium]